MSSPLEERRRIRRRKSQFSHQSYSTKASFHNRRRKGRLFNLKRQDQLAVATPVFTPILRHPREDRQFSHQFSHQSHQFSHQSHQFSHQSQITPVFTPIHTSFHTNLIHTSFHTNLTSFHTNLKPVFTPILLHPREDQVRSTRCRKASFHTNLTPPKGRTLFRIATSLSGGVSTWSSPLNGRRRGRRGRGKES